LRRLRPRLRLRLRLPLRLLRRGVGRDSTGAVHKYHRGRGGDAEVSDHPNVTVNDQR
jgi:hypothetical protein